MAHIVHFTNEKYGQAFIRCYRNLPTAARLALRARLVFSAKNIGANRNRFVCFLKNTARLSLLMFRYRRLGIQVSLVKNVNDERFLASLPKNAVGFCSGFNQIFGAALIQRLHPFINIHPSILPYYRGPVPSHWCLQNGELQTGYTFHHITKFIDAGEIIYQGMVPIHKNQTVEELDADIATVAATVFQKVLLAIAKGEAWPPPTTVDASQVYAVQVGYRSFAPP